MSRYYFDVTDSRGCHRDEVGEDLGRFDEAREQCQFLLSDMAREALPYGEVYTVICDVAGRTVYRGKLTYEGTGDP